ncbi:MAG: biotin--[acetyl-CoA-carboxylase] ligase [Elusimicrobia bacterium]|nr:biotin--[acetyl-CoA-carboxylase] ligase [Elusimicrobiota bacterium]
MLRDKIITLLKERERFVREEELTSALGISAEKLWEEMRGLRDNGYVIETVPHLGYKMTFIPDRLMPAEIEKNLTTAKIGRRIIYLDKTVSTMDDVSRLAVEGAQEGTAVVAESQSAGRGRAGRNWFSPAGKGIYFSLLLRPSSSTGRLSLLALLAAVAVAEAVHSVAGVVTGIKWPNDILLDARKAGGILTEAGSGAGGAPYVVVGVGLNVNNETAELLPGTASIAEAAGMKVDRVALLQEIFFRLETYYKEFCRGEYALIIDKWRGLNSTLGKRVKVILPRGVIEGEAVDIEDDGGLLVRNDSGLTEKVTAGDVIHCGLPQRG